VWIVHRILSRRRPRIPPSCSRFPYVTKYAHDRTNYTHTNNTGICKSSWVQNTPPVLALGSICCPTVVCKTQFSSNLKEIVSPPGHKAPASTQESRWGLSWLDWVDMSRWDSIYSYSWVDGILSTHTHELMESHLLLGSWVWVDGIYLLIIYSFYSSRWDHKTVQVLQ